MYTIGHAQLSHIYCGNYATANVLADELVALADEKGASLWKAFGIMNQGLLFALTGNATHAVQKIGSGLTAWRSTGSTLWMPYLSHLARAQSSVTAKTLGATLSEAMTAVRTTKERWCEADVHRIAGDITLMSPRAPPQRPAAVPQSERVSCFPRSPAPARRFRSAYP
jgi:hypothetical protein